MDNSEHRQAGQPSGEAGMRAHARAPAAAPASPRLVTTGGNIPPGDAGSHEGKTAHIDWFACTVNVRDKTSYDDEQLIFLAELLRFLAIKESQIVETDKGWFGYTNMAKIVSPDGSVNYGLLAYGGKVRRAASMSR